MRARNLVISFWVVASCHLLGCGSSGGEGPEPTRTGKDTGGTATGGSSVAPSVGGQRQDTGAGGSITGAGGMQAHGGSHNHGGAEAAGGHAAGQAGSAGGLAGSASGNGGSAESGAPSGGSAGAPSTACNAAPVGTRVGDVMQDFTLRDQNGKNVSLSDYCGKVVVLELGAGWCPYCMAEARLIPGLMEQYGAQGLVILSVMAEDPSANAPSQAFLQAWAEEYSLATPVLADPGWTIRNRYPDLSKGTPNCMLVGRDGRIKELTDDSTFCARIRNQIPVHL